MKNSIVLFISLLFVSFCFAGVMDGPGAPALSKGDIILGGKLALGAVYGANVGFIVSGEYGVKEGFLGIPKFPTSLGVGGSIGYSSHSVDAYGWGDITYSNYLFLAAASWHIDLLKNPKFDTYVVANAGFNIDTISKPKNYPGKTESYGGLIWGLSVGARYYFIQNLAAVGEVGFGMGLLRIGLDYKL